MTYHHRLWPTVTDYGKKPWASRVFSGSKHGCKSACRPRFSWFEALLPSSHCPTRKKVTLPIPSAVPNNYALLKNTFSPCAISIMSTSGSGKPRVTTSCSDNITPFEIVLGSQWGPAQGDGLRARRDHAGFPSDATLNPFLFLHFRQSGWH